MLESGICCSRRDEIFKRERQEVRSGEYDVLSPWQRQPVLQELHVSERVDGYGAAGAKEDQHRAQTGGQIKKRIPILLHSYRYLSGQEAQKARRQQLAVEPVLHEACIRVRGKVTFSHDFSLAHPCTRRQSGSSGVDEDGKAVTASTMVPFLGPSMNDHLPAVPGCHVACDLRVSDPCRLQSVWACISIGNG